jgi:predicted kinase
VRECHGDLHLGNLVLLNGRPTPFDAIEFNDDFRWIDVAAEIAFTYLDLLDHGQPGLAAWLLNEWLLWSGDYDALTVLRFYAVYRAVVRAKVAAIQGKSVEAAEYLAMAETLTAPPPASLTITFGLSGSGKTTAAKTALLADARAATIRLRSDVERKRLFGLAPDAASGGSIYGAGATVRTYGHLRTLAETILADGWSVLVDAAFLKRAERDDFRSLAARLNIPFAILACEAPDDELRRRLTARTGDASEATAEVLEQQLRWIEPLGDEERG